MIARDCAILLSILLASELIRKLFRVPFLSIRLAIPYFSRTVICGLGHIGRQLLEDLGGEKRLVVIESNRQNPYLEGARELGAIVIIDDCRSQNLHHWIRAHRAEEFFLVTGSDAINIETVSLLANLIKQNHGVFGNQTSPKVHVQIGDSRLNQMLRESDMLDQSGIDRHVFNILEAAAEELVSDQLLDHRPTENQVAHFVIYGFGKMGQTLAFALAEFAHFENNKRSRMTILYHPDEKNDVDQFLIRYPHFCPDPGELHNNDFNGWDFPEKADSWGNQNLWSEDPIEQKNTEQKNTEQKNIIRFVVNAAFVEQPKHLGEPSFLNHLQKLDEEKNIQPILILCEDEDDKNAASVTELRPLFKKKNLKFPVFAWIPSQPYLAKFIQEQQKKSEANLSKFLPFGQFHECCSYDAISHHFRDELAQIIYNQHENNQQTPPDQIKLLKNENDYDMYWSNLSTATHIPAKLAVMGLKVITQKQAEQSDNKIITKKELQQLTSQHAATIACMEHNRWMDERLLRNWEYEPFPEHLVPNSDDPEKQKEWEHVLRDRKERKVRHQFIPFEDLDEFERDKDLDQIHHIIHYFFTEHNTEVSTLNPCLVTRKNVT